jgi:hypothetical protein
MENIRTIEATSSGKELTGIAGWLEIVPGLVESGGARLRAPYAACSC